MLDQALEPLECSPEEEECFMKIKTALISAPALDLPDYEKSFYLYIHERDGFAQVVRQPKAKFPPDPKMSDIVFFSADYLSLGCI